MQTPNSASSNGLAAVHAEPPPGAAPISLPDTGFVRLSLLLRFVPFSKSTLWRRVKSGTFPAPCKLSNGVTAWRVEDIRTWIAAPLLWRRCGEA